MKQSDWGPEVAQLLGALVPRRVWIELTSACPFDCLFCSRKLLRGAGIHMPIGMLEALLDELDEPEIIRLNYSGESLLYPELERAVESAKATGACVELVTALACASRKRIDALAASGLDRLTVSLHAATEDTYKQIYRHSSLAALRERLEWLTGNDDGPEIDLSFVAMRENLSELAGVAALAREMGIRSITVHPVIRRAGVGGAFDAGLTCVGERSSEFVRELQETVDAAAAEDVRISIASDFHQAEDAVCGAGIATCEQNPWETVHVLANGDVVACEAQDRVSLGSLREKPLREIWRGAAYAEFRARYLANAEPGCRACAWRRFVPASEWLPELDVRTNASPQWVRGWHAHDEDGALRWSTRRSAVVVKAGARISLEGVLLPDSSVSIISGGYRLGEARNESTEVRPFRFCAYLPETAGAEVLSFEASRAMVPKRVGLNGDRRELGFGVSALTTAAAEQEPRNWRLQAKRVVAWPLVASCGAAEWAGRLMRAPAWASRTCGDGITVAIPESGTPGLLERCLESVGQAEAVVLVNGAVRESYRALEERFGHVHFCFEAGRMGFSAAVVRLLDEVRTPWVYLLNSDAELCDGAIEEAARARGAEVFAVASQILCEEDGRRIESNWTRVAAERGLVRTWDALPLPEQPSEVPYAGATGALFRTDLLLELARSTRVYDPFYWEDVEWGFAAAARGLHSLLAPRSGVRHLRRGTVGRHFTARETERIFERNRVIFQLRGFSGEGTWGAALDALGRAPARTIAQMYGRWGAILSGRFQSARLRSA